jgi:hypothetical protein
MTDENQPPNGPPVPPQQPVPPVPPAAPQYQAAPPVPPAGGVYQPQPGYGPQPVVPGKTLGIVGLILSIASFFIIPFIGAIAGIVVSAIARSQSKKAGVEKNTPAFVGLILGIVSLVLSIIGTIIVIVIVAAIVSQCSELGPGVSEVNGMTYTCG